MSSSTISRWERGLHKGYAQNIRKLAKALDVEPAVLTPADDLLLGSQLDRIEQRVEEIYELLGGTHPDPDASSAEEGPDDVIEEIEEDEPDSDDDEDQRDDEVR